MDSDILTMAQAAAHLKVCTEKELELMRRRGEGPKMARFGSGTFYRREDLDAWLASQFKQPVTVYVKSSKGKRKARTTATA